MKSSQNGTGPQMKSTDLVCLCEQYDLKELFGAGFVSEHPWINLLRPDEVTDPGAIRHAMAFRPGPEAFDPYPNLALVHCGGAGVDGLLSHPGLRPEIGITRMINPEQARMMASFAVWYIIGWHRRMWDYAAQQAAREWRVINLATPSEFPVGILGYGSMGKALASSLGSLGFPVTAYAGSARRDGAVEVLSGPQGIARIAGTSRAVVNLLPLTAETTGILSAGFFAAMRDDAILIQLGRGAHLVEADLCAALDAGRPAMAAVDVVSSEPLPPGHPFWRHEKIMLTPHAASESEPGAVARWIAGGIRQFEQGEAPQGLVDRQRGY
jgi:glyoxylate/hydroxypyruvate reductase A